VPDLWVRFRQENWGRPLKTFYAADPFLCPGCGGTIVVVGVIDDPVKVKAIIEWAEVQHSNQPEVGGRASGIFAVARGSYGSGRLKTTLAPGSQFLSLLAPGWI
jgi:hypothetical protein